MQDSINTDKYRSFLKSLDEFEKVRVVRLRGAIVMDTIPEIQAFREDLRSFPSFQAKHVIVDFKEMTQIDTSAIAGLISVMVTLKATHHQLVIIHSQESLNERIKLLKLKDILRVYSSEEEAFQNLK